MSRSRVDLVGDVFSRQRNRAKRTADSAFVMAARRMLPLQQFEAIECEAGKAVTP